MPGPLVQEADHRVEGLAAVPLHQQHVRCLADLLATAANAPVIATVPTRMAQRYGPLFGLALSPSPLKLRLPGAVMIGSAQLDQDPASSWIRQQLADLLLEQPAEAAFA